MPKPISNEEREKIIKHKQNGEKTKDIARWLFVSESAITKIWRQFKQTSNYFLNYTNCGRKSAISTEQETKIFEKIKEEPDITILDLIDLFSLKITESGLSKWLNKREYSFKKRQLIRRNKTDRMSRKNAKNL